MCLYWNASERVGSGLGTRIILSQRMKRMVRIVGKRSSISRLGIEKELEKVVDRNGLVYGTAECLDAAFNFSVGHGGRMADALEKTLQLGVLDDAIVVPVCLLDDVAEVGIRRFAIEVGLVVLLENGAKLGLSLFNHVGII